MTRYPGDKARLNLLSVELKRLLFNDRNAEIQNEAYMMRSVLASISYDIKNVSAR